MIQRIQSLYLFIVFAAYVALFFLPVVSFQTNDLLYDFGNLVSSSGANIKVYPYMVAILIAMPCIVFVTIFLFKKRILQIRMTTIALLINVLYVGALFFVIDSIENKLAISPVYEAGIYVSLIPLVFLVLASRAIRKDEKMVRSSDRLR